MPPPLSYAGGSVSSAWIYWTRSEETSTGSRSRPSSVAAQGCGRESPLLETCLQGLEGMAESLVASSGALLGPRFQPRPQLICGIEADVSVSCCFDEFVSFSSLTSVRGTLMLSKVRSSMTLQPVMTKITINMITRHDSSTVQFPRRGPGSGRMLLTRESPRKLAQCSRVHRKPDDMTRSC